MLTNLTDAEITYEPTSQIQERESKFSETPIAGELVQRIGTGENAKNSIIWMTITWSFIIAGGISLILLIGYYFCSKPSPEPNVVEQLVRIWSIFAPIITLALGYAFGRGEKSS